MKTNFALAFALGLVAVAPTVSSAAVSSWTCAPRYPGYALQNFRDYETQVQTWHARYQAAPAGSPDAAAARQQVQANSDAALNVIADPAVLLGNQSYDVETLAADESQKLAAAPAGSLLEGFYRTSVDLAWNAYVRNTSYELSCAERIDWQSSTQMGDYATLKLRSAAAGSKPQTSYTQVAQAAWQTGLQQIQTYATSAYVGFRNLENMGIQFTRSIPGQPAGSDSDRFYRQATDLSFNNGVSLFRTQIKTISTADLYNLVSEYDMKARNAPPGSPTEQFSRTIRNESQNEITARGSNPTPNPTPNPNPTGYYCTVTTPRGYTYYGTSQNQFTAINLARNTCSRYEPYYICNQTPAYCRLTPAAQPSALTQTVSELEKTTIPFKDASCKEFAEPYHVNKGRSAEFKFLKVDSDGAWYSIQFTETGAPHPTETALMQPLSNGAPRLRSPSTGYDFTFDPSKTDTDEANARATNGKPHDFFDMNCQYSFIKSE